jgi:hypothetical protein
MKTRKAIAFGMVCLVSGGIAKAAHVWEDPQVWWSGHFAYDIAATPKFTAAELSMDAFGSFIAAERGIDNLFKTNIRHGIWGGGVGLNYFFIREIGVGADINIPANGGKFIDQVVGNLIARWPFESCGLAPYVFGGGGGGTEPTWEWLGHVGAGLEYRFNPGTGIFFDGRYMWAEQTFDHLLLRAGLRLVF